MNHDNQYEGYEDFNNYDDNKTVDDFLYFLDYYAMFLFYYIFLLFLSSYSILITSFLVLNS